MTPLRRLRKQRGLTQYELADATGVSQARICHIERYGDPPSLSNARILAAYFDVPIKRLFPNGTLRPAERGTDGRFYTRTPVLPPEPPEIPRPLALRCWKCGAVRVSDNLTCYQCGAWFDEGRSDGQAV